MRAWLHIAITSVPRAGGHKAFCRTMACGQEARSVTPGRCASGTHIICTLSSNIYTKQERDDNTGTEWSSLWYKGERGNRVRKQARKGRGEATRYNTRRWSHATTWLVCGSKPRHIAVRGPRFCHLKEHGYIGVEAIILAATGAWRFRLIGFIELALSYMLPPTSPSDPIQFTSWICLSIVSRATYLDIPI